MKLPDEAELDRENAFLLYATFCGDVERTAHALGVSAVTVLKVADDEGWANKLGPILALKKSSRPGDVERAINRALNFVQAHRMRVFLSRVVHKITGFTDDEFNEYLLERKTDKEGKTTSERLTTRSLADLASAMEKAHSLTYMALSDTAQDRTKRKEADDDSDVSAGNLHAKIAAGLASVRESTSPRAQLFDAQLSEAENLKKPAADDSYTVED